MSCKYRSPRSRINVTTTGARNVKRLFPLRTSDVDQETMVVIQAEISMRSVRSLKTTRMLSFTEANCVRKSARVRRRPIIRPSSDPEKVSHSPVRFGAERVSGSPPRAPNSRPAGYRHSLHDAPIFYGFLSVLVGSFWLRPRRRVCLLQFFHAALPQKIVLTQALSSSPDHFSNMPLASQLRQPTKPQQQQNSQPQRMFPSSQHG